MVLGNHLAWSLIEVFKEVHVKVRFNHVVFKIWHVCSKTDVPVSRISAPGRKWKEFIILHIIRTGKLDWQKDFKEHLLRVFLEHCKEQLFRWRAQFSPICSKIWFWFILTVTQSVLRYSLRFLAKYGEELIRRKPNHQDLKLVKAAWHSRLINPNITPAEILKAVHSGLSAQITAWFCIQLLCYGHFAVVN